MPEKLQSLLSSLINSRPITNNCMWFEFIVVFLIVGAYFLYKHLKEQREFEEYCREYNITVEELAKFDGISNKRVFVSIKGDIFDVSSSPFYSPSGSYRIFAGKDATVSLARGDLDGKFLNQSNIELNDEERAGVDDWYDRFEAKYRKVGKLMVNGVQAWKNQFPSARAAS